jgi:Zn-dependent oligopeptidase
MRVLYAFISKNAWGFVGLEVKIWSCKVNCCFSYLAGFLSYFYHIMLNDHLYALFVEQGMMRKCVDHEASLAPRVCSADT